MELNDGKIKVLAYYLPQFHPIPENDQWWGPGFTEWTNVGNAKPLFRGHYQPKVPADLGYYDLRVPQVAERQAQLARQAGIAGFCYWHYWFGNGKMLLEMPAERMLKTGAPDFPFCFAWANHGWWKKSWVPNGSDELLQAQQYPGIADIDAHFYYCLPFFKDERYMRYDGKPVFIIYKHIDYPDVASFIARWNELARQEGLAEGFYFATGLLSKDTLADALDKGFDAGTLELTVRDTLIPPFTTRAIDFLKRKLRLQRLGLPKKKDYKQYINEAWQSPIYDRDQVLPVIMPNWDHTPRSGKNGLVYVDATPENFSCLLQKVLPKVDKKSTKLVVLKSWNEWGEGNYMEPDMKFGHGFIDALANSIKAFYNGKN